MTNDEKRQLGQALLLCASIILIGWLAHKRVQHVERERQAYQDEQWEAIYDARAQRRAAEKAEEQARGADYYSPEKVAERQREQAEAWEMSARISRSGKPDLDQLGLTEQQYQELMGANMAQVMSDPLSGRSADTQLRSIQNDPELTRYYGIDPSGPAFQRAFRDKHQEMVDAYNRQPAIIVYR